MNLAISNLASDDLAVITNSNISLLECIFSKIKPILELNSSDVNKWRHEMPLNLTPYSVQSITYGCDLSDFNYSSKNTHVIDKIIEISLTLQIKVIVFGSPKLRRGSPDPLMFDYIEKKLTGSKIIFCIEPNARIYQGEYFFDIEEICDFLSRYNFKHIQSMIDTHNSLLENRSIENDIFKFKDKIKHFHASEIDLNGFSNIEYHKRAAQTLKQINYPYVVTLESINMNGAKDFINVYGNG